VKEGKSVVFEARLLLLSHISEVESSLKPASVNIKELPLLPPPNLKLEDFLIGRAELQSFTSRL
jgi:hypothetical protein